MKSLMATFAEHERELIQGRFKSASTRPEPSA